MIDQTFGIWEVQMCHCFFFCGWKLNSINVRKCVYNIIMVIYSYLSKYLRISIHVYLFSCIPPLCQKVPPSSILRFFACHTKCIIDDIARCQAFTNILVPRYYSSKTCNILRLEVISYRIHSQYLILSQSWCIGRQLKNTYSWVSACSPQKGQVITPISGEYPIVCQ